ncbi:MAG: hypothetical protein ACRD63_01355 [Pyrinomonadaceae bacterium]
MARTRKSAYRFFILLSLCIAISIITTSAQNNKTQTSVSATRVIGEVTQVDAGARKLAVKADNGDVYSILLAESTVYKKAQPGASTLDKATSISLADIALGDRVLALGQVNAEQKTVPARLVVVMTKADIAVKHERDREEWRRRGIVGTVTALDPAKHEITLSQRVAGAVVPVVIDASVSNLRFRRYAPDSVKFQDASPGSFDELKVGDQLRALGTLSTKSADESRFTPEEIVFGTFQTISGTVESVNMQSGEVMIRKLSDGKEMTLVVNNDSALHQVPTQFSKATAVTPGILQSAKVQQEPGATGQGLQGARGRGMIGGRPGGFDSQSMIEKFPSITLADLKPGSTVMASSTVGAQDSRASVITLLTGAEAFANSVARPQRRIPGLTGTLLPDFGGFDLGIGLP